MEEKESIWNRKQEEIVRGYCEGKDTFTCVLCGEQFEKGRIYQSGGEYFDALGMVKAHLCQNHGSVVEYLLSRESGFLGVSEAQRGILKMMAEGKDDRAIAQEAGIAQSTVRNHRFKLREKQKQAKMFLALMEALETQTCRKIGQSDQGELAEVPQTARQVDERYVVTDADREKTIKTYMDKSGAIRQFPSKEKKKLIVLQEVMKNFEPGRDYAEKEINKIIKPIYKDFSTIRRYLIEYGFLTRSADCSVYRVKE